MVQIYLGSLFIARMKPSNGRVSILKRTSCNAPSAVLSDLEISPNAPTWYVDQMSDRGRRVEELHDTWRNHYAAASWIGACSRIPRTMFRTALLAVCYEREVTE